MKCKVKRATSLLADQAQTSNRIRQGLLDDLDATLYMSRLAYFYSNTRLPMTRWVKLSLNFELLNFPNQLY